ncbi:MAG: molybdopterin biosynthesis protein [Methanotrichaceae archaeon]|nr:molybdopterin biosynthesis protein [Methanotrichaceae archaeon]
MNPPDIARAIKDVSTRKEFRTLISLSEAQSIVLNRPPLAQEETISLDFAFRRVLAEKIISEIDVPGFNRATMDGYAVRSSDTLEAREDRPICLKSIGNVAIGSMPDVNLAQGEGIEISTGSMMPPVSDAVVMVEHSNAVDDQILIFKPVYQGENVQTAGSDIMVGEAVLFPGTIITARDIGVLASVGRHKIRVKKLLVGLASTGNELALLNEALGPGQIYDINSHSIAAATLECGGTPIKYGILPDDHEKIIDTLFKMSNECCLILLSGSTSAGKGDLLYKIFDEIGEILFHGINLKPGKPTMFGLIERKPAFGLPGYPTSALTVFSLLVAPIIRKALGLRSKVDLLSGKLAVPVRSEGRQHMLAVCVKGGFVYPVDMGSGSITTLSRADGVIEIPSNVEYLEKGDHVDVQLFGESYEFDIIIAGENCLALEMLAEVLPYQIKFLNNGVRGIISLQDGLADIACIPCDGKEEVKISSKFILVCEYVQEIGLMAKDEAFLKIENITNMSILGWSKDSEMSRLLHSSLRNNGINLNNLKFIGEARTHSAVAASVAFGKTELGFGEKAAAESRNLAFRMLARNRIKLIATKLSLGKEALKTLISFIESSEAKDQ